QEPEPLPYLRGGGDWALDVDLELELNGTVVSRTNAAGLYWSMPQQLAHATSNGASVRTGDLMASGTISGAERGSEGSLIELTRNGVEPLRLPDGSQRTFLEDGDEVVLRARGGALALGEVRRLGLRLEQPRRDDDVDERRRPLSRRRDAARPRAVVAADYRRRRPEQPQQRRRGLVPRAALRPEQQQLPAVPRPRPVQHPVR